MNIIKIFLSSHTRLFVTCLPLYAPSPLYHSYATSVPDRPKPQNVATASSFFRFSNRSWSVILTVTLCRTVTGVSVTIAARCRASIELWCAGRCPPGHGRMDDPGSSLRVYRCCLVVTAERYCVRCSMSIRSNTQRDVPRPSLALGGWWKAIGTCRLADTARRRQGSRIQHSQRIGTKKKTRKRTQQGSKGCESNN